jgi:hypothetical protein
MPKSSNDLNFDLKSKSQITGNDLNRDFKSFDFKSYPTLGLTQVKRKLRWFFENTDYN